MLHALRTILALLLCMVSGCCCRQLELAESSSHLTPITERRGVALIIHGLNTMPALLDPIAQLLAANGFETVRLVLPGHGNSSDVDSPEEEWLQSVKDSLTTAKKSAQKKTLLVVGYSLGGLLAVLAILSPEVPTPDRMVLVAPAITTRVPHSLLSVGSFFPFSKLPLPSLAPAWTRRWCSIPASWYGALGNLRAALDRRSDFSRLKRVPTQVLLSPNDEVISFAATREWINSAGLADTWSLIEVDLESIEALEFAHNLVDLPRLDRSSYRLIVESLLAN
jgi:esterase/lipase